MKNNNKFLAIIIFLQLCLILSSGYVGFFIGNYYTFSTIEPYKPIVIEREILLKEEEKTTTENEILIQEKEQLQKELFELQKDFEELEDALKLAPYTDSELETLCKIARAEAGPKSKQAQKNVVYVILNRVNHNAFPDNVQSVVDSPGQFTSYSRFEVTDELMETIIEAILDYEPGVSAQNAVFFAKGRTEGREYLFTDEVGHIFEKRKED